jgi:hypothetical protein
VIRVNYGNSPGPGNQHQYGWHGAHRQGIQQPSKSFGAKSGGFGFGGDLPVMPPAGPPQTQELLPSLFPDPTAAVSEITTAPSKAGGFSLANLNEIKGFVDRMGGIDGILSTVTKVQKVMASVSQMAPLVKVLMGSFGKKKSATVSEDDTDTGEWRPKRRKRRKSPPSNGSRRRTTKRKR